MAHEALIQFASATNSKADVEERGLAVAGIGQALTLQLGSPHVQDIDLAKALVALLDDDSVALRAQAFAILKPALPASPYQPDADKAARLLAFLFHPLSEPLVTGTCRSPPPRR